MNSTFSQKAYQGIIFDLDGTLVDTVYDLVDSLNVVLNRYGFTPATYEQGKRRIGNGLRKLIQRSVPEDQKENDEFINQALQEMKYEYAKRWVSKSHPMENASRLLAYCKTMDIPVAVSSNKPDDASHFILKSLFPELEFKAIRGYVEGSLHKPDPSQTLEAAEEMKLNPQNIIYVGDSITDYQTAKNSGMASVLTTNGYGDIQQMKKLKDVIIIDSLLEIPYILKYGKKRTSLPIESICLL